MPRWIKFSYLFNLIRNIGVCIGNVFPKLRGKLHNISYIYRYGIFERGTVQDRYTHTHTILTNYADYVCELKQLPNVMLAWFFTLPEKRVCSAYWLFIVFFFFFLILLANVAAVFLFRAQACQLLLFFFPLNFTDCIYIHMFSMSMKEKFTFVFVEWILILRENIFSNFFFYYLSIQ